MLENAIKNRYEFIMLYDVVNGNPNGDPDADNMPRIDPETGHGIVTDVCIKRKIRNFVDTVKDGDAGYNIYVKQDVTLNAQDAKGVQAVKDISDKAEKSKSFRDFMCENFFDIRTFGAVMTTAIKKESGLSNVAGQVRGPVQLNFGVSIDPIVPWDVAITRVDITTEEKGASASTEFGRKHVIPYGLYRQEGYISANLAQKITGFSDEDLDLLWTAIINMFENDHSAARGKMVMRELIVFQHESPLGNAPSHKLFDLVTVECKAGVEVPRAYTDYTVAVNTDALPERITCTRLV